MCKTRISSYKFTLKHFKGRNKVPTLCQQFTTIAKAFLQVSNIRKLMGWAALADNWEEVGFSEYGHGWFKLLSYTRQNSEVPSLSPGRNSSCIEGSFPNSEVESTISLLFVIFHHDLDGLLIRGPRCRNLDELTMCLSISFKVVDSLYQIMFS